MNGFASRAAAALMVVACPAMPAAAADVAAGKAKAGEYTPCHGANGLAVAPDAPNLAGDSVYYLTAQLKAFRGGERKHEQMSIIAKGLTDEDIADLAAWFSAITVTATLPKVE